MKKLIGLLATVLLVNTAWGQKAGTGSPPPLKDSAGVSTASSAKEALPMVATPLATSLAPSTMGDDIITDNLNSYMVKYINSFYKDNTWHLQAVQSKGEPYFDMIEHVFRKFGIPDELKYLAVIESGLNKNAVSRAGAVGTWQLMAGTARLLGLKVTRGHDERRDLYKSTMAAAKYLSQLYDMLNDWVLVVAAYNCGPGGVLKAINASGSDNFWKLENYLPSESRNHVMKFLATAYIMDRFANFFGLDKSDLATMVSGKSDAGDEVDEGVSYDNLKNLQISGKYSMPVIAKYLAMDISELNRLNPGFDKMMSNDRNSYNLQLPADKMEVFKAKRGVILNESVQLLMENNRKISSAAYPQAKTAVPKDMPAKKKG